MGVNFPDAATLHSVLDLATRAPSVNDAQPWRWRVGHGVLDLFADPSRDLPRYDGDHDRDLGRRAALLSCGAALHHCVVALAAMGWHATVARLPHGCDSDHLACVEVNAQPADDLDIVLASTIRRRRSDPRRFGSSPVAWGDIAVLGARAARAGVMLRRIDPDDAALVAPGDDTSVMVALGTGADDALARLRAGEACSLVLLSATAMGLASCPVTEPLEVPRTREAVRTDVFGGNGHPQMMVRMGWAAFNAEPLPDPPRRPLVDVTDWPHVGDICPGGLGAFAPAG